MHLVSLVADLDANMERDKWCNLLAVTTVKHRVRMSVHMCLCVRVCACVCAWVCGSNITETFAWAFFWERSPVHVVAHLSHEASECIVVCAVVAAAFSGFSSLPFLRITFRGRRPSRPSRIDRRRLISTSTPPNGYFRASFKIDSRPRNKPKHISGRHRNAENSENDNYRLVQYLSEWF